MLKNEIPFEELNDGDIVWGCAYSRTIDGYSELFQLPIKGIVEIHKSRWQSKFAVLKKDGITPRGSGIVSMSSRHCFKTYEDCVNGFNELIDNGVNKLKCVIENMENEKLSVVEGEQ